MAFDTKLADRVRAYLAQFPALRIAEKKMFGGLAFMVNGKMCVNVSGHNLICRFDPLLTEKLAEKRGFLPMVMKGKTYKGYCYVEPIGINSKKDLEFWINCCLQLEAARSQATIPPSPAKARSSGKDRR